MRHVFNDVINPFIIKFIIQIIPIVNFLELNIKRKKTILG